MSLIKRWEWINHSKYKADGWQDFQIGDIQELVQGIADLETNVTSYIRITSDLHERIAELELKLYGSRT